MTDTSPVNIDISMEEPRWQQEFPQLEILLRQSVDNCCALLMQNMRNRFENAEISVLLSNNDTIQELNNNYRGKNKPTNILSFPMDMNDSDMPIIEDNSMPQCLGDLALALDVILKEAQEQNKKPEDHLRHLVVHGFLHLQGYDHEADDQAEVMETLEIEILSRMQIKNPYEVS